MFKRDIKSVIASLCFIYLFWCFVCINLSPIYAMKNKTKFKQYKKVIVNFMISILQLCDLAAINGECDWDWMAQSID